MKDITVYDPAMCCSTGVCGPDVDPILPRVAGMLAQLKERGVQVGRYNLARQPMAFAQNSEVRELLDREGVEVLPVTFIDGEIVLKGRYPDQEMRAQWIQKHVESENQP
ncbi:MAG: arsenite efflux transporter metallochaperone ArsD [Verrucomicrobiae bacterium]